MKPVLTASLFALAVAFQAGIPVAMIAGQERLLREGEVIKLRTAPVDPYDAFRGRYVQLGFGTWSVPLRDPAAARRGQWLFVNMRVDADGFATPVSASVHRPASGTYLRLRNQWGSGDQVTVDPPLDRYYLEESRAPQAEDAYRNASNRTNRDAYVVARVKDGKCALEDLVIGGRSVREIGR